MGTTKRRALVCVGIAVLGAVVCAGPFDLRVRAQQAHAWDYEAHGPVTWGSVSPEFVACAEGRSQSPIDINKTEVSTEPAIRARYKPASLRIVHNIHTADVVNTGHSIQVNFPQGDALTIGDATYSLVQFHFHGPSEHTVNGKHFPMEMHLVHMSADKKLAVIAVLLKEGKANKGFDAIIANLPSQKGVEIHVENVKSDVEVLMPRDRTVVRYEGSLTTPPCSEGVKWMVLRAPGELSAAQIKAFSNVLWKNNRPVQPLNGRKVFLDRVR